MQPKSPDLLALMQQRMQSPQMIRGNGSGVEDDVPAVILDKDRNPIAPAALSEGEFVIPADVVSNLGAGATDPGARFFDELVEYVREMDRNTAAVFAEIVMATAEMFAEENPVMEEADED